MAKHTTEKLQSENRDSSLSPKYRGVRKRKWGKHVSEIRLPNSRERIWLGSYDSAEKAARAFDAALFCLRGRTAKFNFPDNPPDICGGRSMSPSEIQEAAARFANSGDPVKTENSDRPGLEYRAESPSTSVSDATTTTLTLDSDLALDEPFFDTLLTDFGSDFWLFPGFEDLSSDFLPQPLPSFDLGQESFDGYLTQDSFFGIF